MLLKGQMWLDHISHVGPRSSEMDSEPRRVIVGHHGRVPRCSTATAARGTVPDPAEPDADDPALATKAAAIRVALNAVIPR